MMTPTEINKAVAEARGYEIIPDDEGSDSVCYKDPETGSCMFAIFSFHLEDAVDHLVPVLDEMKWRGSLHMTLDPKHPDIEDIYPIEGSYSADVLFGGPALGNTPSERMAHALCQVFLKVAEQCPEELKKALERLAA